MSEIEDRGTKRSQIGLAVLCGALPGLFLLVTSTTFLVEGQFVYDVKRILELFLMLALFMAAALNAGIRAALAQQLARIPRWLAGVLGMIIILGIISSFASATSYQQAINSLLEVALLSLLVMAALVIAACRMVAGRLFDQVAISLLAASAIAVGIQEVLGVAAALANQLEFFARISLMHYSWPRFYNQVQAWVIPVLGFLPAIWAQSNSELLRSPWFQAVVCLLALTLHWYIILMTGGRGVAISLLFTFLVCLAFLPATRRPLIRWHLPGLVLGALLFLAIAQMNQQVQSARNSALTEATTEQAQAELDTPAEKPQTPENQDSFVSQSMSGRLSLDSSGRLRIWRGTIDYIRNNPVLGIGPMNYACIGPPFREGHPHNFALQFAAEWGLPATMGLVLVLAFLIRQMWKALRSNVDRYQIRLASMLATGVVAAAVYSSLSGVLTMPASQVLGLLIGGWFLGVLPLSESSSKPRAVKAGIGVAVTIVISASATVFAVSELSQREHRESIIATLDQGIPRFWQQGKQCKYFSEY